MFLGRGSRGCGATRVAGGAAECAGTTAPCQKKPSTCVVRGARKVRTPKGTRVRPRRSRFGGDRAPPPARCLQVDVSCHEEAASSARPQLRSVARTRQPHARCSRDSTIRPSLADGEAPPSPREVRGERNESLRVARRRTLARRITWCGASTSCPPAPRARSWASPTTWRWCSTSRRSAGNKRAGEAPPRYARVRPHRRYACLFAARYACLFAARYACLFAARSALHRAGSRYPPER